jgi:hypothetical protein
MRLDTYLASEHIAGAAFLKLDVQGAEMMVLSGATDSLKRSIAGIQVEMSLDALYEGQSSAWEIDRFLQEQGFRCWDMIPGFVDPSTLRLLQYDGIYFK